MDPYLDTAALSTMLADGSVSSVELVAQAIVLRTNLCQLPREPGDVGARDHQVGVHGKEGRILHGQPDALQKAAILRRRAEEQNARRRRRLHARRQQLPIRREHLLHPHNGSPRGLLVGRALQQEPGPLVAPAGHAPHLRGFQPEILHLSRLHAGAIAELLKAPAGLVALGVGQPVDVLDLAAVDGKVHAKHGPPFGLADFQKAD